MLMASMQSEHLDGHRLPTRVDHDLALPRCLRISGTGTKPRCRFYLDLGDHFGVLILGAWAVVKTSNDPIFQSPLRGGIL
jgi:hypothetical protein